MSCSRTEGAPASSSSPASAASVQTFSIVILLHQFFEGWALRACPLKLQLKSERGEQFSELGKAHLPGASVLKRVHRGTADPCLAREGSLAELERLTVHGDPATE